MSREHKYRVWDKQRQRMIVVAHLHFGDDGSGRTIILQEKTPEGYIRFLVMGENAELMQYTGLHDRAGKEVYKGDIVKATVDTGELTSVTETVFYHEKYAAFYPFCRLISYADGRWIDCLFDGFEVIGNIYEHPELMRKP